MENKANKDGLHQNFGNDNHINPCPFCGAKEGVNVFLGYEYPKFRISCVPCEFIMYADRKDKVIANWNQRVPISTLTAHTDSDIEIPNFKRILKETPLEIRLFIYLQMDDYDNWDNGSYKGDNQKIKEKVTHIIGIMELFLKDSTAQIASDAWVDVKDRLPEIPPKYWDEDITAWLTPCSVSVIVYDGKYVFEDSFMDYGKFCTEGVTHWQPLPPNPFNHR